MILAFCSDLTISHLTVSAKQTSGNGLHRDPVIGGRIVVISFLVVFGVYLRLLQSSYVQVPTALLGAVIILMLVASTFTRSSSNLLDWQPR
jgi:hypothetical protein